MLPKRETLMLVSGYSIAMRGGIIDRRRQLKAETPGFNPKQLQRPRTFSEVLLRALGCRA